MAARLSLFYVFGDSWETLEEAREEPEDDD
jgi:hypothetical protein